MGDLLDFSTAKCERCVQELMRQVGTEFYGEAERVIDEYAALADARPDAVIDQFGSYLMRVRSINKVPEAMCGGPNHDWTAPIINVLGAVYPSLPKEERKRALTNVLKFLDAQRYDYAQNNVERIDEPWLAGDIVISRHLYWCGYAEYYPLLDKHSNWESLSPEIERAHSKFWMAMSILRVKKATLGVRAGFYAEYPVLVDRTLDAIAGKAHSDALMMQREHAVPYEEDIADTLRKYDPIFRQRIREKIKEEKWIELP